MERKKLTPEEVAENLKRLNGWSAVDDKLTKRFSFPNFAESLGFVSKVGQLAEKANHHPDIKFGWGYAEFKITTHDRGGITDFDFALAEKIDAIGK